MSGGSWQVRVRGDAELATSFGWELRAVLLQRGLSVEVLTERAESPTVVVGDIDEAAQGEPMEGDDPVRIEVCLAPGAAESSGFDYAFDLPGQTVSTSVNLFIRLIERRGLVPSYDDRDQRRDEDLLLDRLRDLGYI